MTALPFDPRGPKYVSELYRTNLALFARRAFRETNPGRDLQPNWHIQAICHALEQVARGKIKRLLINVPPRHLKSHLASICFPAWMLARDPTARIITVSYAQDLAKTFSRTTRNLMQSGFFREMFPHVAIDPAKNTEGELATTQRGFRFATSVGGTLTGRGGSLIIVDDPLKPEDAHSKASRTTCLDWVSQTLLTRLDDKNSGAIVVVMQRLHVDDVSDYLLEQGGWHHLNIPAIADDDTTYPIGFRGPERLTYLRSAGTLIDPAREGQAVLDELKRTMGSTNFSAQYMQAPVPAEGEIINWGWFPRYDDLPAHLHYVISWDTAIGQEHVNDYSAGIVLAYGHDRRCYVVDVIRKRLRLDELLPLARLEARKRPGSVTLIENSAVGVPLAQGLQREGGMNIILRTPKGDKTSRLQLCAPMIESGRVLLPQRAGWLNPFHDELVSFPGRHDDQVDALSQGLAYVDEPRHHAMSGRQTHY